MHRNNCPKIITISSLNNTQEERSRNFMIQLNTTSCTTALAWVTGAGHILFKGGAWRGTREGEERAASRCPQDFLRRPKRHRSLQPRSKGSLPPVYGAREMDRRENLRTRLEKVIFYMKRGQFILRFLLNKQMKCGVLSNQGKRHGDQVDCCDDDISSIQMRW